MSEYSNIIGRLEAATGITMPLWKDAVQELGINPYVRGQSHHFASAHAWTDACLALVEQVLPGWEGEILLMWDATDPEDPGHYVRMRPKIVRLTKEVSDPDQFRFASGSGGATLAIAILLALFRALETQEAV